jgi:hypothetical protein
MIALVLATLSAAPLPRAAAAAQNAVFVPRLDKLGGIRAFGERAGERSVLLRPSSWASEFHPLLDVDPTQPASLTAVGIDPAGDATVSWVRDGKMTCTAVSDPKLFQARADQRLGGLGELARTTEGGATVATASVEKAVRAGYVLKGRYACAFDDPGGVAGLQAEAGKRARAGASSPAWQHALSLQGVAFGVSGEGSGAVQGAASELTVQARSPRMPLPAVRAGGLSPYGAAVPSGLFFARGQVEPAAIPDLAREMTSQVSGLCSACDAAAMGALAKQMASLLTGNVMVRVDRLAVRDSLRTEASRYFALKHAYLAELSQPAAASAALARVGALPGARAADEGFMLTVAGGDVLVGVHGRHLFVANDSDALAAALAAVPEKPAKLAHGAEFWLDPQLASKALRQVTLLDLMSSAELASLFAAGTELGPLLTLTDRISGWADGGGDSQRASVTWALKAP